MLALLVEIRDELRLLNSRGSAKVTRSIPLADEEMLRVLLPAISLVLGDSTFTANELVEHHAQHDADLQRALKESLGEKREKKRVLGNLFARRQREPIAGFEVRSCGNCPEGTIWQVVAGCMSR